MIRPLLRHSDAAAARLKPTGTHAPGVITRLLMLSTIPLTPSITASALPLCLIAIFDRSVMGRLRGEGVRLPTGRMTANSMRQPWSCLRRENTLAQREARGEGYRKSAQQTSAGLSHAARRGYSSPIARVQQLVGIEWAVRAVGDALRLRWCPSLCYVPAQLKRS